MVGESILLYLHGQGEGDKAADLFLGGQPDAPDGCITIYEETAPVLDESQAYQIDTVGIQVIVRDASYRVARDKCQRIHGKLAGFGLARYDPSGPMVRKTDVVTPPSSIGKDANDRAEWTAHYAVQYRSANDLYRTLK